VESFGVVEFPVGEDLQRAICYLRSFAGQQVLSQHPYPILKGEDHQNTPLGIEITKKLPLSAEKRALRGFSISANSRPYLVM